MPLKLIARDGTAVMPPVRPNAGFEAIYRRKLVAMVKAMQADVSKEVKRAYAENEPEIAQDDSPAMALRKVMAKMSNKWQKRFDDASLELAKYFSKGVLDRSDASLRAILSKGGFTVPFKMTPAMNDVVQARIGENVGLIKSIASQHLTDVEGMVMRSIQSGRDMHTLSVNLKERYDVTTKRAALIARSQNNMATAQMTRARQTSIGIVKGIWRHNRAGNHPREKHVAFDGHEFLLSEGHDFGDGNGKVLPGQPINCHCTWSPVIPGLSN